MFVETWRFLFEKKREKFDDMCLLKWYMSSIQYICQSLEKNNIKQNSWCKSLVLSRRIRSIDWKSRLYTALRRFFCFLERVRVFSLSSRSCFHSIFDDFQQKSIPIPIPFIGAFHQHHYHAMCVAMNGFVVYVCNIQYIRFITYLIYIFYVLKQNLWFSNCTQFFG